MWPMMAGYAGWHMASLLAPSRLKLASIGLVASSFLLTLALLNSYRLAAGNVFLLNLKGKATTTTTTTTTTTASTVAKRTAICFADQYNSGQANSYLVLTQTEGEQVMVRGVAVGGLVTGAPLPLLLKQGGDVSCSLATVETLASDGMFDLSQTVYSVTVPAGFSIGGSGTDLVGMNLALDSLPNGCCTIARIA